MKVHPDTILEKLKGETNTRGGQNLEIVHKVCREIFNSPAPKDYSLVTVGKRSQEREGPSLNTFYSPKGARFREVVKAWAEYDGVDTKKPNKPTDQSADEEMLVSIKDLALRARVGSVIAKRNSLQGEVNVHKANAQVHVDLRPTPGKAHLAGNQLIQVFEPLANLLETEIAAVETCITERWLESRSLKEGPDGEILNAAGDIVLPVGFANAIRKILGGRRR